jgi:hypothetical protein
MSVEDLLKIRNFGQKSLGELREKLAEHGVTDLFDGPAGSVGDISLEDLVELMGDERADSDAPSEAPAGMSLEDPAEDFENDDNDPDEDEDEDED